MKSKSRKRLLSAGLLMAVLAYGCQTPMQSEVGQPRTIVYHSGMQFAPNADLALSLDFKALLPAGFRVQSTTAGPIARIVAKVTGPRLAEPVTASVDIIDCPDGTATLNFTHLPPGKVDVIVNAVDHAGNVVAWANNDKPVAVTPGQTQVVPLTCSTQTGGIAIVFDCPSGCGASPSPTPTPAPLYPANPLRDQRLDYINTITIDAAGSLYLVGYDPGVGLSNRNIVTTAESGRIIRITPDLQIDSVDVLTDYGSAASAHALGDKLYVPDGKNGKLFTVALNAPYPATERPIMGGVVGEAADGDLIQLSSQIQGTWWNKVSVWKGAPENATLVHEATVSILPVRPYGYLPINITTDLNNEPVWSSTAGLATWDTTLNEPKRLLGGYVKALAPLDEGGQRTYLYSTAGTNHAGSTYYSSGLTHYDMDTGETSAFPIEPALDSDHGIVRAVRGPDGFYYLLIFDHGEEFTHGVSKMYYVKKYRLDHDDQGQPKLVKVLDMVDTVNPSPAPNP